MFCFYKICKDVKVLKVIRKCYSQNFVCDFTEGVQEKVSIGEEYCVTVNADEAGNGAITCHITSSNTSGDVDIHVEDNGDGTFSVFYSVKEKGDYSINIKFGGNPVPGGSFSFQVFKSCNSLFFIFFITDLFLEVL